MKREQYERVKQLTNDYFAYLGNEDFVNGIAGEGKSMEQRTIESGGQWIPGSGIPFNPVERNVEKVERHEGVTPEQRYAAIIFEYLSEEDRKYLLAREFYANRDNSLGKRHTVETIAVEELNMATDEYKYKLKLARSIVFSLDRSAKEFSAKQKERAA